MRLGWIVWLSSALAVSAHVSSPDIPKVHSGEAHRIAKDDPSKVTKYEPDQVYHKVSLDRTPRPGDNTSLGWANPSDRNGSMLDVCSLFSHSSLAMGIVNLLMPSFRVNPTQAF